MQAQALVSRGSSARANATRHGSTKSRLKNTTFGCRKSVGYDSRKRDPSGVPRAHPFGHNREACRALSVCDAGMGELRRQLAYKTEWHGSTLVIADRFYPSSKTFSGCGVITDTLALSARVFACDACGISVDRDENAAINL
ncbi:MAG: transposase, partial [Actinobacteria bacterium]